MRYPEACCEVDPKERLNNELSIGINTVTVRWFDGYIEEFEATEVRFGSDLLWMRLRNGKNRHIPLRSVRWFGMTVESHQAN